MSTVTGVRHRRGELGMPILMRRIYAPHTSPDTGLRLFDSCRGIAVKAGLTKGI